MKAFCDLRKTDTKSDKDDCKDEGKAKPGEVQCWGKLLKSVLVSDGFRPGTFLMSLKAQV